MLRLTLTAERGAVFEAFVVSELYKNFMHHGEQPVSISGATR